jgi:exopolysaccharide biosynthesis protein
MKRVVVLCASVFFATVALADWDAVVPGVEYQRFNREAIDVHVTRVDLTNPEIVVAATRESERGLTVSDFAKRTKAVVAINADFFNKEMKPLGLAIGPCGVWEGTKDNDRAGLIAVGAGRGAIYPPKEPIAEPEEWVSAGVSGWPMLVAGCTALTATELPGSDAFTRSPHPRTAAGLSEDGTTLYLVVADGRREGVPGLTLAKLARFMKDELGVCSAINLDGGGSSAMWVSDAIVNKPSDKSERRVADHLAVVLASDYTGCDVAPPPPPAVTEPAESTTAPTTTTTTRRK